MKTILILEDNAREMERLVKIVREQGAQNEVICAVNLEQAYHMAMEKSIYLFNLKKLNLITSANLYFQ